MRSSDAAGGSGAAAVPSSAAVMIQPARSRQAPSAGSRTRSSRGAGYGGAPLVCGSRGVRQSGGMSEPIPPRSGKAAAAAAAKTLLADRIALVNTLGDALDVHHKQDAAATQARDAEHQAAEAAHRLRQRASRRVDRKATQRCRTPTAEGTPHPQTPPRTHPRPGRAQPPPGGVCRARCGITDSPTATYRPRSSSRCRSSGCGRVRRRPSTSSARPIGAVFGLPCPR